MKTQLLTISIASVLAVTFAALYLFKQPVKPIDGATHKVIESELSGTDPINKDSVVNENTLNSQRIEAIAEHKALLTTPAEKKHTAQTGDMVATILHSNDSHPQIIKAKPVVVPQSFSATDAAAYFISKDQRSAGNLGGPPPINFPGSPGEIKHLS